MPFEALTDKLTGVFRKLGSRGIITEKDLDEALREVRIALLEADVHFKVVRQFVAQVRERALGAQVLKSLTPAQQVIGIVNEELTQVLGGGQSRLQLASTPPSIIMLVGLKGSGKTTTAAKLGLHLRRQGGRPLLVAADPQRMAAAEQLVALGKQLNIPVFSQDSAKSPVEVCERALAEARRTGITALIIDTAGYLEVSAAAELANLRQRLNPSEVLLVADAMTGQGAVETAHEFHQLLGLTGLILTKMDGDARGGAALSIRAITGLPVKFIGTGEKTDALEPFYPDRIASRILGMGDVLTLVERAKEAVSDQDAAKITERMRRGDLTLEDFLNQLNQVRKMGSLGQLMQMLPGLSQLRGRLPTDELSDNNLKKIEAIILSMTPQERRHPDVIDGSRRRRIAMGSGTTVQDVNQLLKQYREAKKVMQMMASRSPRNLMGLFR